MSMARYLVHHRHAADECGVVFSSFKGHTSPLRRVTTVGSCRTGGHAIWWQVQARTAEDALALLPSYVAARSTATEIREVRIP